MARNDLKKWLLLAGTVGGFHFLQERMATGRTTSASAYRALEEALGNVEFESRAAELARAQAQRLMREQARLRGRQSSTEARFAHAQFQHLVRDRQQQDCYRTPIRDAEFEILEDE